MGDAVTTEGLISGIRHMGITPHAVIIEVTDALSSPVSRFLMGYQSPSHCIVCRAVSGASRRQVHILASLSSQTRLTPDDRKKKGNQNATFSFNAP